MSFQFINNPSGSALSGADLVTSALDQPMSMGSTFWDQAKGGALESFGLGTILRSEELPPVVSDRPARGENPEAQQRRFKAFADSLSEEQYKASPSFRKSIPWQQGLTDDRAAALAEQDDRRKVREFYASKRPVTSFFGNLGGQAVDPINYIPVFGEAVASANVARFGRVAGRALTSSLDAAANTAIAGLATAPIRQQLGDDISWQNTVSQIAMAAVIGGAFGAVAGKFGRATPTELRAEAETKLATLKNVQESRVALNDALDGMIHQGEVNVSPASIDIVRRVADEEVPKVAIERMARETDPASFDRLDALNRTFDINDSEIRRLQSETMDNERFGPTRAAMIEADRLAEQVRKADAALQKAPSVKQKATESARLEKARDKLRQHLGTIDDSVVQQIEELDASLAARRQANEPVVQERSALSDRAKQIREDARKRYWAERPAPSVRQQPAAGIDQAAPVAAPDQAVAEAVKRVARPEASREMAEQYRVNPETGEFAEQSDLDQLIAAGRLTEEDQAMLDEADATIKSANAYSEAVKAFASCSI